MSLSLRDQLLQAGLISQKQAKDAEREQQRQEQRQHHASKQPKHPSKHKPGPTSAAPPRAAPVQPRPPQAKVARDQALNKQQQEKAQKKALLAQIKQLVEQNRLPTIESEDFYNFVDGDKIRRMPVNADVRARLMKGDLAIVRHGGGYDLVPKAIAARIHERNDRMVVPHAPPSPSTPETPAVDDAYAAFTVPDDLMW